jgi:hypothetical protein
VSGVPSMRSDLPIVGLTEAALGLNLVGLSLPRPRVAVDQKARTSRDFRPHYDASVPAATQTLLPPKHPGQRPSTTTPATPEKGDGPGRRPLAVWPAPSSCFRSALAGAGRDSPQGRPTLRTQRFLAGESSGPLKPGSAQAFRTGMLCPIKNFSPNPRLQPTRCAPLPSDPQVARLREAFRSSTRYHLDVSNVESVERDVENVAPDSLTILRRE